MPDRFQGWPKAVRTSEMEREAAILVVRPGSHRATSQLIQIIAPPLRHPHSLIPVVPAIVGASDGVAVAVGEGAFDCK